MEANSPLEGEIIELDRVKTTDLVESMDRLHAEISARQREQLRLAAELDLRKRWERDGCRDMAR